MRSVSIFWMRALVCVRIGDDADLAAGEADGRLAQVLDGHRHQGDRFLLARGQQHVHFAGDGVALTSLASSISSSVLWPRALTTITT